MKQIEININSGEQEEYYTEFFVCPNCKDDNIMRSFNYCPMCGKEIKWIGGMEY